MSKEATTREKFFSEMQRIEDDLLMADALGVSPPQNWTTVAAERILSLRDDAARYRWLRMNRLWLLANLAAMTHAGDFDAEIGKARAEQEVAG